MLGRLWQRLRSPSKAANARALRERGETAESLLIREATASEIPALAVTDGSWFCLVVENRKGELVGFAKGVSYAETDQSQYSMLLFGTAGSPACRFYAGLGGGNLVSPSGEVSAGNFGWRDLRALAALCPSP